MPTQNNNQRQTTTRHDIPEYQVSDYEKEHPFATWWTQHVTNPIRAFLNTPVSQVLDNTYPFGYTNSRATTAAQPVAAPVANMINTGVQAVNNVAAKAGTNNLVATVTPQNIAETAGAIDKFAKAFVGYKTPAAKAAYAFADLDLDNPANMHIADSLSNVMRKDEPRWGRKGNRGNYRSLQKAIRGRIDLNRLHTTRPQLYNTYMINDSYHVDDEGDTYVAADPKMRQAAMQAAKAYLQSHPNAYKMFEDDKHGKLRVYTVNGADPYLQFSNYSIITDADGSNPRFRDTWDFGLGPVSSNQWWPTKTIHVGDRIH